jgi:hypothetical protein
MYKIHKLHIISRNAITCQIIDVNADDLLLNLPNCPTIIVKNATNDMSGCYYDANVFKAKN